MPPMCRVATLSTSSVRWRRPMRRFIIIAASAMTVITPRPPIWMPARSTQRPKTDQWVAVSTTTRPVTQTALVAVNSAVSGSVHVPARLEAGSISSRVTSAMIAAKPSAMTPCALIGGCLGKGLFLRCMLRTS